MLSGGARCRQTARHLATSRVTFWSCGRQPRRAPPASSRARRADRRRSRSGLPRPQPAEVRAAPDPLTRPRAPGLGARLPSRPRLPLAQMAWRSRWTRLRWLGCWACCGDPREPGDRLPGFGVGAEVGASLSARWTRTEDCPTGTALGTALPCRLQSPQWAEGIGGRGRGWWLPGGRRPERTRASTGRGHRET